MELSKAQLKGLIILVAFISAVGTGVLTYDAENTYYCESRDMVLECYKLSAGVGTRCYFEDTYKICKEGWQPIENFYGQEREGIDAVEVHANGKDWVCEVIDGKVQSYSKCKSGIYEGYLGELV